MKLKRVTSAILSMALCLSLGTVNASALEVGTETDLISENTIAAETVDISQLIGSAAAEADGLGYDIAAFGNAESSEKTVELPNYSEELYQSDEGGIMPYSSNPPVLQTMGIIGVYLGNDELLSYTPSKWTVAYTSATPKDSIDISIDATNFKYIRFRTYQWGLETSQTNLLDNKNAISSYQTKGYNQLGGVISAGQILYGYEEDYIFEIPDNKKRVQRNSAELTTRQTPLYP